MSFRPVFYSLFFWLVLFCLTETPAAAIQPDGENALARNANPGLPLVASFTPEDYRGHPQTWGIIQDSRGFVYVGKSEGFLLYDGARWQRVFTKNRSFIREFVLGHDGLIYAGGNSDLGYIGTDSLGRTAFYSLESELPEQYRDYFGVRDIVADHRYTYFLIRDRLFIWDGSLMAAVPDELLFYRLYEVDGEVYALKSDHGLYNLTSGGPSPLPGIDIFRQEQVRSILDFRPGEWILLSLSGRMFTYSKHDGQLSDFEHNFQHLIDANPVSELFHAGNGIFAMVLMKQGLILFDEFGRLISRIHEENGLNNSFIHHVYMGLGNQLWVSTDRGVNRVDLSPHISRFDKRNGLNGRVESIISDGENLLVATSTALYKTAYPHHLELLHNLNMELWDLKYHEGSKQLLLGGNNGLIDLSGPEPKLAAPYYIHEMIFPTALPGYLLGVSQNGVVILKKDPADATAWNYVDMLPGIRPAARFFTETPDGTIWLGSMTEGVYRIQPNTGFFRDDDSSASGSLDITDFFEVTYYPSLSDYHRGGAFTAFYDGILRVTSPQGLFKYDEQHDHFVPDSSWGPEFAGEHSEPVWRLFKNSRGTVFLYHGMLPHARVTAFYPKDSLPVGDSALAGKQKANPSGQTEDKQEKKSLERAHPEKGYQEKEYIAVREPFRIMPGSPLWEFYEDRNGLIWIGGNEALFTYREDALVPPFRNADVLIRMVTVNQDSLVADLSGAAGVFGLAGRSGNEGAPGLAGHSGDEGAPGLAGRSGDEGGMQHMAGIAGGSVMPGMTPGPKGPFEFGKQTNHVRIDFALPLYQGSEPNQYRYRLLGVNNRWSDWSADAFAPFMNIGSGNYVFELEARNVAVDTIFTASLQFRISPPWYQTYAAIALFAFMGVAVSFAGVRYISLRQLRNRLIRLERERDVQQERERMSQELHDHLGSNLTNVISGLELASHFAQKGKEALLQEKLADLAVYARGAMQNLRHTIWSLDEVAASVFGLRNHIRDFLKEVQYDKSKQAIRLDDKWDEDLPLMPNQALNLFRIVQEAVQNALKHSDASRIDIKLCKIGRKKWGISIIDNGCGYDTGAPPEPGHYGLYNMQRRAEKAMATVKTVSQVGKGTEVRIIFTRIA